MSTIKADGIQASTGTNTDLTLAGKGTGVPDLAAGFKVGGTAGVPTASIRDDAVTIAKLAAATDGVIITYDASGNPVHVGPGSDGEVLTSTGAGSPPAFEAAGGGGRETIISATTISTSTLNPVVSLSGYTLYRLQLLRFEYGSLANYPTFALSDDDGSTYENIKYVRTGSGGDASYASNLYASGSSGSISPYAGFYPTSTNGYSYADVLIYNQPGQPVIYGNEWYIDDTSTYSVGFSEVVGGITSPGGSDVITDIKITGANPSNPILNGLIILSGLAITA